MSTGFPKGGGRGNAKVSGQAWTIEGKTPNVFISPILDDSQRVLDVLVHELVHVAVGCQCGHRGPFKRLATGLGLTGKMTATVAGEDLLVRLGTIISAIGEYPHEALIPAPNPKKQSTRMIKVECGGCGYVARVSRKWIGEAGAPLCPCNQEEMRTA